MPKIESLLLRCRDPQSQRQFYCDVLGMKEYADGSVGYGGEQASILFVKAEGRYDQQATDTYWKIALAVADIDLAYQQLIARNIQVNQPGQFQDVGFLAHFSDPEGFTIELIDHWFQDNRPTEQLNQAKPLNQTLLGGGAHFNLLTLRTADIDKVQEFCTHCGLTTLCIQPVESHGFTLYFFAFTTDIPPSPDLYSTDNREWLYQRKYTILEVQHLNGSTAIALPSSEHPGYGGTMFSGLSHELLGNDLLISGKQALDGYSEKQQND